MPFSQATDLDDARHKAARNCWTISEDGSRNLSDDMEKFRKALFDKGGSVESNFDALSNEFKKFSIRAWNAALNELRNREIPPEVWEYVRTLQYCLLAIYNSTSVSGAGMPDDVLDDYNDILAS